MRLDQNLSGEVNSVIRCNQRADEAVWRATLTGTCWICEVMEAVLVVAVRNWGDRLWVWMVRGCWIWDEEYVCCCWAAIVCRVGAWVTIIGWLTTHCKD